MTSKSTKSPWHVNPVDYGRSLKGLGINLLVRDMEASLDFYKSVVQAHVNYWNEDFAVLSRGDVQWMLHADHTYSDNSYQGIVTGQEARGTGIELRLYDLDPDLAEAKAREGDFIILNGSLNKPHGLRECYLLDPDGYCWVPSRPLTDEEVAEFR
ncbi:MAG: hypothetical protein R3261_10280 [Alphaproteobacteria bacterium]|nr:hypothetical protein [Alphaproteobacteria bacterium]